MKDQILREILYKIRTRPDLKKKLKIAILVGVIGVFVTGALLVWAGIAAVNFVGSQLQATNVKGAVENLQTEIKNIPAVGAVNTVGCWTQAQSMMTVETWLNRPLADNFNQLKKSCLQSNPSECVGEGCQKPKESPSGSWG